VGAIHVAVVGDSKLRTPMAAPLVKGPPADRGCAREIGSASPPDMDENVSRAGMLRAVVLMDGSAIVAFVRRVTARTL